MATYGRLLEGEADALVGYQLEQLVIDDPSVVEVSGKAVHTIARATGNPADRISGTVFELSDAELHSTDAYETKAYSRIEVTLGSSRRAFAYVAA